MGTQSERRSYPKRRGSRPTVMVGMSRHFQRLCLSAQEFNPLGFYEAQFVKAQRQKKVA
jgi:hypothetical protein